GATRSRVRAPPRGRRRHRARPGKQLGSERILAAPSEHGSAGVPAWRPASRNRTRRATGGRAGFAPRSAAQSPLLLLPLALVVARRQAACITVRHVVPTSGSV